MESDQTLIKAFQQSKEKTVPFTALMVKYQKKVYLQIKRMVAEHADVDDIAQTVWIKVWNKLMGFKMESEFTTWLYRIAYNESINFIHQRQKRGIVNKEPETEDDLYGSIVSNDPSAASIEIKLDQAIAQLPEKQKFVFMLRYFEEMNYEKIAIITGTSVGGAKANYHQALKKMETFFKSN
jgi:RNA polymerase sigma factor (sigma-70 family)